MYKRIVSVLIALIITTTMIIPTYAITSNSSGSSCRIKYVSSVATSLTINKGTAYVGVKVRDAGKKSTKITVTAYLQKKSGKSWKSIASWTDSTTSNSLTLNKSKKLSKGRYRVKSVTKAYKGKASETITDYSPEKKY